MYKYWTPQEEQFVRDNYGQITVTEIMKEVSRSRNSIERKAVRLGLKSKCPGSETYSQPHNKGKDGLKLEEHPAYREPGATWVAAGRVYFKQSRKSKPELYSRYLMKQAGVDIKNKVVIHLDGDPMNCELSNLKAISRAENVRRNYNRCADKELRGARIRMGQTGESFLDLILKGEFV